MWQGGQGRAKGKLFLYLEYMANGVSSVTGRQQLRALASSLAAAVLAGDPPPIFCSRPPRSACGRTACCLPARAGAPKAERLAAGAATEWNIESTAGLLPHCTPMIQTQIT